MSPSSAVARLQQVVSAITGSGTTDPQDAHVDYSFNAANHLKFQASLPKGLPVNKTPLNPVSFLLRSATIRGERVALQHPAKGLQWTYAEW